MQYGNQDKEQKHDLSKIANIPDDRYVVRHYDLITYRDGSQGEDHTTSRIQVYTPFEFDRLNTPARKKNVDGSFTEGKSPFQELGLNVHVLHDPTADASGEDAGESIKKTAKKK